MSEREDGGEDFSDEFVEIDWEPLQAAIDALADGGLELTDHETVLEHLGVLLASYLRRIRIEDPEVSDEEMAEMAASVAALAVQIVVEEDEVPPFVARDEE